MHRRDYPMFVFLMLFLMVIILVIVVFVSPDELNRNDKGFITESYTVKVDSIVFMKSQVGFNSSGWVVMKKTIGGEYRSFNPWPVTVIIDRPLGYKPWIDIKPDREFPNGRYFLHVNDVDFGD